MKLSIRTASNLLAILYVAATTAAHYPAEPDTTATELQIRNKLSLYAISLDLKNYAPLTKVFAQNTVADYQVQGLTGPLRGVRAVQEWVKESLAGQITQHTISTTLVEFIDPHAPNSTAYLVANYLGQGNLTGQAIYFYGKYVDRWGLEAGSWKITNRVFTFFPNGIVGNLAIVGG